MDKNRFYLQLKENFLHSPTEKQDVVLQKLAEFVFSKSDNEVFLLKGYAGTGKTTIISTLVKLLPKTATKAVLLAPTGRAAKVIGNYSEKEAFTIHKKIYYPKAEKGRSEE